MLGEPTGTQSGTAAPADPSTRRKRILIAIGIAGTVLLASVGAALVLNTQPAPTSYLELYITDLPADFSRFDVRVAAVEFGPHRTPLQVEQRQFDLLALRGPDDALRIAHGSVRSGQEQEIHIRFESGVLELDHKTIAVDIPDAMLTVGHDFGLTDQARRSVLFDIDVDDSLTVDGPKIRFEPVVKAVYVVTDGTLGGGSSDRPMPSQEPADQKQARFSATEPEEPTRQALKDPPQETTNPFQSVVTRTVTSTTTSTAAPSPTTTSGPGEDPNESAEDDWLPEPGDADNAGRRATDLAEYYLHYAPDEISAEQAEEHVRFLGATVVHSFESLPALYVAGQEILLANITTEAWVTHVEPVMPIEMHLASSKPAIRGPEIADALNGIKDAKGNPIDGRGIGVAVVDTGIDGLHPDMPHGLVPLTTPAIKLNFKVASNNLVDMINTDTTSGHGTHVAGIVAGRGTKDPSLKGVAPGAILYGFGIGDLDTTLWPNQAFDWIIQYGHRQSPPIRIVTNSWGTAPAPHDPNSVTSKLVQQMVNKGIIVVFSAGNNGVRYHDAGGIDTTSPQCKIPYPGVLCVAWYDDVGGSRNGAIADGSSKGRIDDAATWPDISAPGSAVRSARTPFGWVTGVGLTDYYVTLDGSSMAAPHVAGAAALMLQANPGLSPSQVESIVKQSAYKYGGAADYGLNGNFAKGHGLLDAYEAVRVAKTS